MIARRGFPARAAAIAAILLALGAGAAGALAAASALPAPHALAFPAIGGVVRESPALDALIAPDARVEKLADGFTWAEGPVWVPADHALYFSDVPANAMYRWTEGGGASVFLKPSGYAGTDLAPFREPGSNGLIRGPGHSLILADGSRAVSRLDLGTKAKVMLATGYGGKRFNSPNDLVRAADGSLYFTDPPYGLKDLDASPAKELKVNGVYRLAPDGEVRLVAGDFSFPNGIALSPDGRTLYVSNSDPKRAVIVALNLGPDGMPTGRRIFADMTALVAPSRPGMPDGMTVDARGNLFASGPGGLHVLTPAGVELGLIRTGDTIANCKFGEDGRTLFLASNHMIARIRTRTRGLGF